MNIPVAKVPERKNNSLCPQGTFQARIVQIIDLGTITKTVKGQEKIDRTFVFRFETPTKTAVFSKEKGEQPFLLSTNVKFYFTSEKAPNKSMLHRITLGASMRPSNDFNIFDLLDKAMMINVVHSEDGQYANIESYSPMPDEMQEKARVNELKYLYLTPESFDQAMLDSLAEYTQNKIKESPEYQQIMGKLPDRQSNAIRAELPEIDVNEVDEMLTQSPF